MAERTDDGRRYMPKMKCPYGNHRFADVPDLALRNDSELKRLSEAANKINFFRISRRSRLGQA